MNFIEVVKYLKEDSCNVVYHECWLSVPRNWITHYLITKDKKDNVIPRLHTFEEALKALKEGKTIKRKSSAVEFYHDYTPNTIGSNSKYTPEKYDGNKWVDISFTNDDILANDWIIIDDEGTK